MTHSLAAPRALSPASSAVRWWPAAIVLLILLAYANSFPSAFFFDDDAAIVHNASLHHLNSWRVLWPPVEAGIGGRPFANLTYALNYAFGGVEPAGYHLVNVLIHLGATLLLFALVRRTLELPRLRGYFGENAPTVAALAALLWGLHPLQTNIVDYASQRTEGLMALLYLATLYGYVRSVTEASRGWAALAVAACALGMATKEDMVTAPVMVLLYDRTFLSGSFRGALQQHRGRLLALASTWLLLGALMATSKLSARGVGFGLHRSAIDYALTECQAVVRYLRLSLWPDPLIFDYGPQYVTSARAVLPEALVLVLALGGTVWALVRRPTFGFLAAWFFVVLSPSSSVVPVVEQPCAENRVYLPLAAIAVAVATLAFRGAGRRALPFLGVAVLALAMATYARNPAFANEQALWGDVVAKRPENARAQNNFGNALLKQGRVADALPHFDAALRLNPHYADARNNRGVVLLRQHQPEAAMAEFRRASADKADYADAYYNLGEAFLQLHRSADAIAPLRRAVALNPQNPKAHNNLGIALLDTGDTAGAIREEETAVSLDGSLPEAHYNLGNAYAKAGRKDEALAAFDATLSRDPRFAKAHNNAGVLLLNMGKLTEAQERFEAALRIDASYPEAQQNLALLRRRIAGTATAANR